MINTLKTLAFLTLLFGMIGVQSCSDPCKDVVCQNGGVCDEEGLCDCPENFYGTSCETECVNGTYGEGLCDCDQYYEGSACDTEERIKFYGAYDVEEECGSQNYSYASTIKMGEGNLGRIEISYLYDDYPDGIYADVDGMDITIPTQDPDENFTISGSGTMTADQNTIVINYTLDDVSIGTVTCTATFTRQ